MLIPNVRSAPFFHKIFMLVNVMRFYYAKSLEMKKIVGVSFSKV